MSLFRSAGKTMFYPGGSLWLLIALTAYSTCLFPVGEAITELTNGTASVLENAAPGTPEADQATQENAGSEIICGAPTSDIPPVIPPGKPSCTVNTVSRSNNAAQRGKDGRTPHNHVNDYQQSKTHSEKGVEAHSSQSTSGDCSPKNSSIYDTPSPGAGSLLRSGYQLEPTGATNHCPTLCRTQVTAVSDSGKGASQLKTTGSSKFCGYDSRQRGGCSQKSRAIYDTPSPGAGTILRSKSKDSLFGTNGWSQVSATNDILPQERPTQSRGFLSCDGRQRGDSSLKNSSVYDTPSPGAGSLLRSGSEYGPTGAPGGCPTSDGSLAYASRDSVSQVKNTESSGTPGCDSRGQGSNEHDVPGPPSDLLPRSPKNAHSSARVGSDGQTLYQPQPSAPSCEPPATPPKQSCQTLGSGCPPGNFNLCTTPSHKTGPAPRRDDMRCLPPPCGVPKTSIQSLQLRGTDDKQLSKTTMADFQWLKMEVECGAHYRPQERPGDTPFRPFETSRSTRALGGLSMQGGFPEAEDHHTASNVSLTTPRWSNQRSSNNKHHGSPPSLPSHAPGSPCLPPRRPTSPCAAFMDMGPRSKVTPSMEGPQVDQECDSGRLLTRLPFLGKIRRSASHKHDTEDASHLYETIDALVTGNREGKVDSSTISKAPTGIPRGQRELPPLPLNTTLGQERPQHHGSAEGASLDEGDLWAVRDMQIQEKLTSRLLKAVLECEQLVVRALRTGNLLELLTSPASADKFMFFAHVASRFTEGLNLTPAEKLFIMWAQECPKLSPNCSHALLLEMACLFEFIAGVKPLTVPPAVRVLLTSAARTQQGVLQAAFSPAPVAKSAAPHLPQPGVPFTLFFHRISSDSFRRASVEQLVCGWSTFAMEIRSLIFHNNIKKSLDYPEFRTRFLVYAYTAAAMGLTAGNGWFAPSTADPVAQALNVCYKDTYLARRIADPDVRSSFFDAIRVTHF